MLESLSQIAVSCERHTGQRYSLTAPLLAAVRRSPVSPCVFFGPLSPRCLPLAALLCFCMRTHVFRLSVLQHANETVRSLRVRRLRQQGIHLLAYHLIFVSCAQVFGQGARAVRCVSSRFTCYRACRWPWSLSYESGISTGMPQPHSCAHFWNESPADTGWTSSHRGPHTQASKPRRAIEENFKNGSKHGPSFWTGIRSRFRDRAFALLFNS